MNGRQCQSGSSADTADTGLGPRATRSFEDETCGWMDDLSP